MIELYAYPDTYSIGCHMLLEESGVEYRVNDVSAFEHLRKSAREKAEAGFNEASPHRRVPALRIDNEQGASQSLCESGAIALHLSDSLCNGAFSIPSNSHKRPRYLQWLFYLSSTLQPEVMLQFHPEHYFDDENLQQRLQKASMDRLEEIWSVLERQYQNGPWMFDNRPTAVDFCLATVLLWPECFPKQLQAYPNLSSSINAIKQRPACSHVIQWHQGKTPLTGNPRSTTANSSVDE